MNDYMQFMSNVMGTYKLTREDIYKPLLQDVSGLYVEIGTCWGGWAEWIRKNTPATHILTVDPYRKYPKESYCDALNEMTQAECDKKFEMVKTKLIPLGINMARMTSFDAARHTQDGCVSFCYIDGNHHYNAVLQDLVCWWPKIKKGGYLCGDDVDDVGKDHDDEGNVYVVHQPGSFGKYGVAQALQDFKKVCPSFNYRLAGNQFIARKQ